MGWGKMDDLLSFSIDIRINRILVFVLFKVMIDG